MFSPFPQFAHLHSEFLHMREHLNVLLCDVVSGHGRKAGSDLLLHVQLPVVACYRHNKTTSTHQISTSTPACLKQS